jgi:hypothetical protein
MRPEAMRALNEIHAINRFDDYLRIARAELASDPYSDVLGAFVTMVERLVVTEKAKLVEYSAASHH